MIEPQELAIVAGASVEFEVLRQGFNQGFADYRYNMRMGAAGMDAYLRRNAIALEDCAVLVAENQGQRQSVGAALLAVRNDEGWCGGLSVAPPYRGQGWGRRLMEKINCRAEELGVRRILLEVLDSNESAVSLYRQLDFKIWRELLVWERDPRQGSLPLPNEQLEEADPGLILKDFYRWHDLPLSWQRRVSSLLKYVDQYACIGLTIPAKDGRAVAYVLAAQPQPGQPVTRLRILDIAANPEADPLCSAHPLLQALQLRYDNAKLTLMYEPTDSRLNPVFSALGFCIIDRHLELKLDLP